MTNLRLLIVVSVSLFACSIGGCGDPSPQMRLRLATTTSTADSGLLDEILPSFREETGIEVDVIAVGTGQALELGRSGNADCLLVHAREREEEFIRSGHGLSRRDVFYNDFIIAGPRADPALVAEAATAAAAFSTLAAAGATFLSRDDDSGTHVRELQIWRAAEIQPPEGRCYVRTGQGMGATLLMADEMGGYTLTDRATFLAMQSRFKRIALVFGGATIDDNADPMLMNPYGVIVVDLDDDAAERRAERFASWLDRDSTRRRIEAFGRERFGGALFKTRGERREGDH